jgi:hypothetical protein
MTDLEFQATADENAFRGQVGLALRDPHNHNGELGPGNGQTVPDCTGAGNPWAKIGEDCFIVTAATGSATSPKVEKLQVTRDFLIENSNLVGAFLKSMMHEYYGFSLSISQRMNRDPRLRRAVDEWFVEPVTNFDFIFDAYKDSEGDPLAFITAAAKKIPRAGHGVASRIAAAAVLIADRLEHTETSQTNKQEFATPGTDDIDAADPGEVFNFVGQAIDAMHQKEHIAWLARGLALYWRVNSK